MIKINEASIQGLTNLKIYLEENKTNPSIDKNETIGRYLNANKLKWIWSIYNNEKNEFKRAFYMDPLKCSEFIIKRLIEEGDRLKYKREQ